MSKKFCKSQRLRCLSVAGVLALIFWVFQVQLMWLAQSAVNHISPNSYAVPKTSEIEFARRKQKINDVCRAQTVTGRITQVFPLSSEILYCKVPKAGCTFWQRVVRATRLKANVTKDDLFNVSRGDVHRDLPKGESYNITRHNSFRYPIRFLVSRDPYSRLLSAYLDKFYLPDFWQTHGQVLIKTKKDTLLKNESIDSFISPESDFLRQHFNDMKQRFSNETGNSTTSTEIKCAKYITFAEFVNGTFRTNNEHWVPIHELCNPCTFEVTHVSRMETFTADARVFLTQMDMDDVLDDLDQDAQVDEELTSIAEFNFQRAYRGGKRFYKPCVKTTELAYRLWHNFQWRGYIDPDIQYKVPDFSDETGVRQNLMEQIWRARKSGLENRHRMKEAKRQFSEQAFASISKDMFDKLNKKYELDFQLFDYEDIREKLYLQLYKM